MTSYIPTVVLLVTSCCVMTSHGYSFEERLPYYKKGADGSLFGYSAVMHKISQDPGSSMFAIGAPTDVAMDTQTDTRRPGGVWSCPYTTSQRDCTRVAVDEGGSSPRWNKTGEWLGVSMKSQGIGKNIIACAHRIHGTKGEGEDEKMQICGKCFGLDGSDYTLDSNENAATKNFCEIGITENGMWKKKGYAYGQPGVSLAVDGDSYVVGSPGSLEWRGSVFYNEIEKLDFFGVKKTLWSSIVRSKFPMTKDSYKGFSVAVSHTLFEGLDEVIISGAPRYNFTGGVVFFAKNKTVIEPKLEDMALLDGYQVGSSYGYSLLVVDINNDGMEDLVVGAPQYYEYNKHGGAAYVYVKQAGVSITETEPQVLYGPVDSFFGQSLASLGDFDQDGHNDIAIGAPKDNKTGKVYIYRGSEDGTLKLSQVLDGGKFSGVSDQVRGFGVSMSGNLDMDDNKYPDVLIGTRSNFALHLRSRPIIAVESYFNLTTEQLDLINPTPCEGNDTLEGSVCFYFQLCLKYKSRHDEYTEELDINYNVVFDEEFSDEKRISVDGLGEHNVLQSSTKLPRADEFKCEDRIRIEFLKKTKNRLDPIAIVLEYSLASDDETPTPEPVGSEMVDMIRYPVLDEDYQSRHEKKVDIIHDCGPDNLCQSRLTAEGEAPEEHLFGAETLTIVINVTNPGEEAHQAKLYVGHSEQLSYKKIDAGNTSTVSCRPSATFAEVICDLGNPYLRNQFESIKIEFVERSLKKETKKLDFEYRTSTTSENEKANEVKKMTTNVIIEHNILVTSSASPKQVRYYNNPIVGESAIGTLERIGPQVSYSFFVQNLGSSVASGLELAVEFPLELYNEKWLMYLSDTRVLGEGNTIKGSCEPTYVNVNKYGLGTDKENAEINARKARSLTEDEIKVSYAQLLGKEPKKYKSKTSSGLESKITCELGAKCVEVKCYLEELFPKKTATIELRSRVWNSTFLEEFIDIKDVSVRSDAEVRSVKDNVRIVGDFRASVITEIDQAIEIDSELQVFPWWYILIAILIALIIYVLIIFCLFKCGFFKRKHFPDLLDEEEDDVNEVRDDKPLTSGNSNV